MTRYEKTLARIEAALDEPKTTEDIAATIGMTEDAVCEAMCGQSGVRFVYVGDNKWARKRNP